MAPAVKGVQGQLSGFGSPYLPPGVLVDAATGALSGRPTAAEVAATYTIYASDPGGNALSANFSITVNAVSPGVITYGAGALTFTAGIPARVITPQAGTNVRSWSISPQLPAGLAFDTTSGSISGTPTSASPRTPYTVTAQTSTATLTVTVAIEVDRSVVVDLGHETSIRALQFNGSTVLSEDDNGRWVLWDYASGAMIAEGDAGNGDSDTCCSYTSALVGPTAVISTNSGLQIRSAATGAVTANISATPIWWRLATDGSYVVAGSLASLSVWSPSGQLIISRPGNYANATTFPSPGAIRIANGPAGANVLETVAVPGGTDAISPSFQGQFVEWFLDGSGFVSLVLATNGGGTVLLYSDSAAQEASIAIPVNGAIPHVQGSWLWTFAEGTLNVFPLATPTTPIATYTFTAGSPVGSSAVASASTIGVFDPTTGTQSVIDLSGAAPVKVDYASPFGVADVVVAYTAASASQWIAGYETGVLLDGASLPGTPRLLDYGKAFSVAGSANRFAIATASGRILYFNAATLAQEGTILSPTDTSAYPAIDSAIGNVPGGFVADAQLELSADGSTLAVLTRKSESIDVYSLPSGALLYRWPYWPLGSLLPQSISLSGSGTVLGLNSPNLTLGGFTQMASPATGGAPTFSATTFLDTETTPLMGNLQLRLSPDGTQIAASLGTPNFLDPQLPPGVQIARGATLAAFARGWPVGWIDNTHLLVNEYVVDTAHSRLAYTGCTIYDLSGAATGTCALPEFLAFAVIDSDTLFALNTRADEPEIASISSGAVSWTSGDGMPNLTGILTGPTFTAALAGNHVVLVTDSRLVAQSY